MGETNTGDYFSPYFGVQHFYPSDFNAIQPLNIKNERAPR